MSISPEFLTRRAFLGGTVMACLTSCNSVNNLSASSEATSKDDESKTHNTVVADNVTTDEQSIAMILARDAIKRGYDSKYYDLEVSLKEFFQVERFDYYGIVVPKRSDFVRTRYVNRYVEYPSNQHEYDPTTLIYKYIDCHYNGKIINTRQSDSYEEWPNERLKLRIINLYDANGLEETYQQLSYNDENEIDREVEIIRERDEEGHVLNVHKTDSDDIPRARDTEITRECNENGQTVLIVISADGEADAKCEYEYDSESHLVKKSYIKESNSETSEYKYDKEGRLIECVYYDNDMLSSHFSLVYHDEYHRIEKYDELNNSSHCSPMSVYQFNSKGAIVYESGSSTTSLYSYDKDGNMIACETYSGDELTGLIYLFYDEETGLLRSQSSVTNDVDRNDVASAYAFAYENVNTGEVFDYSEIDEVIDLQLNIENTLGPDFWDTPGFDFGENYNTGSEIIATDIAKYRKSLEDADKLSEPKELPPYSELLLHRPITKREDSNTSSSGTSSSEEWVGTWEAQAFSGGVITVHVMSDNTYTIEGAFPTYEWTDNGEWHASTNLDNGIEMAGTQQPIGYALYLKDSSTYLSIDGEELPVERIAS